MTDQTINPAAVAGHNSGDAKPAENVGGVAAGQLKSVIERIERLEEEKAAIAADIRDIFAEAKASGFDTKILRQVLKIRKMEKSEREEQEAVLDVYLQALDMI